MPRKCWSEYLDLEKPSHFQEKHVNFVAIASNLLFELSADSSLNEGVEKLLEDQMNQKKRSLILDQKG